MSAREHEAKQSRVQGFLRWKVLGERLAVEATAAAMLASGVPPCDAAAQTGLPIDEVCEIAQCIKDGILPALVPIRGEIVLLVERAAGCKATKPHNLASSKKRTPPKMGLR